MSQEPTSPAARISEHTLVRRVQFHETDGAGILHFSWYPRYMEEAEGALWRSAGLRIVDPSGPYVWPRVAITADYRRPLLADDECAIRIRITALSGKSIKYACTIARGEMEIASLTMTIVCTERDANGALRAAALPAVVRDRFEASPGRQV
jgi:YbgC/YbaW family acyl-CoA thioester hydrolase